MLLKEQLSKMVGSNEFYKLLGKSVNTKIMKYSELENINDLNDILTEVKDYRIVLIESQYNVGHWTCITRNNDQYVWFDSYGLAPDQEFQFIPVRMQKILDEGGKPLTKLLSKLKQNGGKWNYNTIKFQKQETGINTCGRHVVNYLYCFLNFGFSLKDYQNAMITVRNETDLSYDEIVCECTKVLN